MIPGLSSKSPKAWDKEGEETPKLSQTAAGWRRAVTADPGGPGRRGHPRGGGHPVSRRNKRAERSLRDRASSTLARRWGAGDGYRGATAPARAKEEMEPRVRVVHKGSSAASKPATRGACSGCHPHSRRPAAPREHLPGHRGFPGRRRPRPERGTGLRARWRRLGFGFRPPRGHNAARELRRLCRRPAADTKPAAAAGPRASRAPPPTDLGLRRQAPAASWSPPSRRGSPAGRAGAPPTCSSPRRRAPGGAGWPITGSERRVTGGRPPRLPPCRLAPRAPGPAARLAAPPPGAASGPAAHGRSRLRAPRWVSPKRAATAPPPPPP